MESIRPELTQRPDNPTELPPLPLPTPAQNLLDTTKPILSSRPNYVAIGDSWAGSDFLPTMRIDPCLRNHIGYPEMISVGTELSLRNAACAGAGLNSYWLPSRLVSLGGIPLGVAKSPMRNAIDSNTQLATIQLGLNEFQRFFCWADYLHGRTELQCDQAIVRHFARIRPYLEAVYAGIYLDARSHASPNATVIAVGYSQMFNGDRFCWDSILVGRRTRALLDALTVQLNEAAKAAALYTGVDYYEPYPGRFPVLRTSCGIPYYRYVAGLHIVEGGEIFHYTPRAHVAVAHYATDLYRQNSAATDNSGSTTDNSEGTDNSDDTTGNGDGSTGKSDGSADGSGSATTGNRTTTPKTSSTTATKSNGASSSPKTSKSSSPTKSGKTSSSPKTSKTSSSTKTSKSSSSTKGSKSSSSTKGSTSTATDGGSSPAGGDTSTTTPPKEPVTTPTKTPQKPGKAE